MAALVVLSLHLAEGAAAQTSGALATGQLAIQGTRLSIAPGDEAQVLDVAESVRVRTCFAGACGAMTPGDPRVNGLLVRAELSGPELHESVTYSATPGGAFLLPGVQTEGTYLLSNIRLVRAPAAGGPDELLGHATPSVATLEVRRILATTATVRQLTLADLQARGIQITQQNFDAYNFAVGFAFEGGLVTIDFPVLFQDGGQVDLLSNPEVNLDELTEEQASAVRRWQPPNIIPFKLEVGGPPQLVTRDEVEELPPETKLFGVIVLPGNVSFLHKYFDAQLLVANGAPAGSGAILSNVTSTIRLPAAVPRELLRLAGTTPSVAPGQAVPVLGLTGETQLGPGEQGTASFTLEGVAAGTHVVTMEVAADLERPGRDVLPLSGKLKAAIEVVDARFNLAFNHPDVVRTDEAYTLYVTVTNASARDWENAVTLALDAEAATGAVKADPNDSFQRTIETLGPGEGATVEFRLVAKVTGRCVATAFQSSDAVQGVVRLRTGVGEHGIPLSPSSLVLPRFTGELPEPLVAANVPLLGLAYSLAVAPPGAIPADLPRLIRSDVERRALDLAEAGQRIFIGEERLASLEALLLDQLGNRHDRPEFDQLRRTLDKGRTSAEGLAAFLRQEQEARNLGAGALLEHVAATMSYARPYIAATLESAGSGIAPTLELRKLNGVTGVTYLAYPAGDARALRSLAFGETYDVLDRPGGARAPLAVVGRLSEEAGYSIVVHGPTAGAAMPVTLSFVGPSSSGGGFSHVRLPAFAVPPGQAWAVDVVRAEGDTRPLAFELHHLATGAPVAGAPVAAVSAVERPPFRLIGARQDFVLDPYGSGVWYLFNRPPAKADAEAADRYEVRTSFRGLDTTSSGTTLERTTLFSAASALLQPSSERVVAVRFAQPVSAITATHEGRPVISNEHRIDLPGLRDGWGDALVGPVPAIAIEPDHAGGLVEGKVLKGTGEAVAGAVVRLVRDRVVVTDGGVDAMVLHDLVAERTTDVSGEFFFPFIEEPVLAVPRPPEKGVVQSGFRIQAVVPAGPDPGSPEEAEEVTSIIRLQSRLARVNIALLGRGTITGQVLYEDSSPVPAAAVTAASTLFSEVRSTVSGADGMFRLEAMPVGPITVTARDSAGRSAYATVGLSVPGATADVTLRLQRTETPRTGSVSGRVLVRRETAAGPVTEPASGASVAVYSGGAPFGIATTGASGAFLFAGVPAGRVIVQAADFSVSRTPAVAVTELAADGTASVDLTLAASTPRSVSGQVRYRDPVTQVDGPVVGATVFVEGPGSFALTDEAGTYRIDGVPAQGIDEPPYTVHAIDFARKVEGTTIVSVTEASPDPVVAATIQLKGSAVGSIEGVVLDPLGLPAAGVAVTLLPIGETTSGADGTFSFEGVPAQPYVVSAHKGDGLQTGAVGWIGAVGTEVLFGGHRAYATVRLRGAGTVHVKTRTANGPVRTPVFYKPTWFSPQELTIRQKASAIETTTDDDGSLTLVVPVGELNVSAVSPFYGGASYRGAIDFAGQVKEVDLVFQALSTVTGTVVGVDGVSPAAGVTIELRAHELPPQTKETGQNGEFQFELVPTGPLALTASGLVGTIERTGRTHATVTGPGQSLDVVVRLKAKGTVRGGVVDETAPGVRSPVAGAQVALQENDFPFRRLPAFPGYFTADANGRFEVADVTAGRFTVVARHPGQVTRQGSLAGEVNADFEVVEAGNVLLSGQVGDLTVLVRDPQTGSPVPDAQVTLSNGEATVAGADGRAAFVALPLGTWGVYAFHAPTGSGGRLSDVHLDTAGQALEVVVVLDQKGRVSGTLFDDEARTTPVAGGTVRLEGTVNGRLWGARVTALATTSREAGSLGKFAFDGLPVASYSLTAAVEGSDRRAEGAAILTPTSPAPELALVLDAIREVYARVYQKEQSRGLVEVNPDPAEGDGVFAVSYGRHWNVYTGEPIPIASRLLPDRPYPSHHYRFTDVLAGKSFWIRAEESSGERRRVLVTSGGLASASLGSGTEADPYRIVLKARGIVRVTVRDAGGVAAGGATVRLHAANGTWESAADSAGRAAFAAVEEGTISVSASIPGSPFGASGSRALEWDDQVLDIDLTLSPVVSAHGVVYEAPEDDSWGGDPSTLQPAEGISVRIQPSAGDAQQLITGADGAFRFSGLAPGGYTIAAQSLDGSRIVHVSGTLGSEHGIDYGLPPLILDASRPRIVTLSPPNGATFVSRTAPVEIVFSEPLLASVLPSDSTSSFFHLTFGETPATGTWTSSIDLEGHQVVRFTPAPRYENSTTYSLRIEGGPSGVRDREGRPLTDSGDIGASFTTSDTDGPRVVGTVPSLVRPVDPESPIRIDFGEVLVLTPAQLQAAVHFEWKDVGGTWTVHPVGVSLTRGGYSILVEQPLGVTFTGDSLRRRLTVSGLTDASGNPMPAWTGEYRIYDENPPVLSIGLPQNAPTGDLSAASSYTLSPSFTAPDDVTPENPFGDVDRVEYTFGSALDPTQPASSPGAVLTTAPFAFGFVASYVGDGSAPRPFPVWVKAFDTSGNPSEQVRLDMRVLPNSQPVVAGVTVSATAPVAGEFYAGSTLSASVGALSDADDALLTISAELRRGSASSSELVASAPARSVDRPAEGWAALPAQTFSLTLPNTEAEGTALFVRVRAVDSKGAVGTGDAAFAVADDAVDPDLANLVARRPNGDAATSFVIGETFALEVTAHDSETGVKGLVVTTSGGTLPPTLSAARVGTSDLFRTDSVTVPATVTEPVQVVVTATAEDFGGNVDVETLALGLTPSSDPTKPAIEWLSPFEGGLWPASYVSLDPGKAGVDLLLRLRVTDRDVDGSGNEQPGSIASVRFRGPIDASGALSPDWTNAAMLTQGEGEWIYEGVWRVPNGVVAGTALPFEAEAVDAGANLTTKGVVLRAAAARYVYEAATTSVGSGSEIPAPAGTEALPVFLLDGTTLSLYPKAAGGPRSYANLHLYSGGALSAGAGSPVSVRRTTLTSPEVTSYESLVRYYPLELSIEETLAIGHGAAIDVTGRGLLGGDATHAPVALPGERASLAGAGGSHGGMGHPPQGEWLARLGDPGSVYGNVREPRLPGGGGGNRGATGGGVVRIEAPSATVRLHGDLLADGGPIPGGGTVGAAGGSIRLRAGKLEGRGEVRASGSFVAGGIYRPSGSGGRVSLSWVEPTIAGVTARADGAISSISSGPGSSDIPPLAGAGTVFLERLDSADLPLDRGTLRISNPSSTDPPAWTRLPGLGNAVVSGVDATSKELIVSAPAAEGSIEGERIVVTIPAPAGGNPTVLVLPVTAQTRTAGSVGSADQSFRLAVAASETEMAQIASAVSAGTAVSARARLSYAAFEARGAARVVSSDDLEVGGVVDDRTAMSLDPSARILLGGEAPTVSFEGTSPAPGVNVTQGTAIDVRFRVADPLGLSRLEETWLDAGTTATRTFSEPLEAFADPTPTRVTVPASQPAGPVTYRVRATDRAGRATESVATWNVVGDATAPVITSIELSPVRTGDVYTAGDTITIRAYATDDVKLARIRISVDGHTIESATSPATLVWLAPPLTTSSTFEVSVDAADLTGNVATGRRVITVTPRVDTVPPTVAIDCPSSGAVLPSGYGNFVLRATASDDLGVHRVEAFREGETTPFATAYAASGSLTAFDSSMPAITLPSVSEPTLVRFRVRAFDFGGNPSEEAATQITVVPAVRLLATGPNDWGALATQTAYLDEGTLVLDQPRNLGGLLVLRGASVTQVPGGSKSVDLTVAGSVFVDCGGSIDVSGRGYPADATYPGGAPGANAAGSHLGVGGPQGAGTVAGTYGSVTRPQEAGSGGFGSYAQPGGGVIRIEAGSVVLGGANAAILANGGGNHSNVGAGGSVWIKTGTLAGDGRIEAAGADAYSSAGGGGAIGIEYGSTSGTVLSGTRTKGGGSQFATGRGGAGTIYLKGPGATYGTLNVDNLGTSGQATVLPSLGSGTAQEGTSGATLVTQLTSIPAYFEGHWVEVRRGESLLGTWRIGEITGGTVTLEPNEVESIALLAGDTWQGVYRFDRVVVTGNAVLQSADPIRTPTIELTGPTGTGGYTEIPEAVVATTVVVSGNVLTTGITATTLTVKAGAKLTSPASTATEAKSLVLDVSGVLTIEEGGSIDVSGRGYPADATYPGGAPGANAAGSHLGVGGPQGAGTVAGTYGSVTRPQEAGSGGFGSYAQPGGGVIRIEAGSVVLGGANAAILANGGGNHSNVGAGGSVWIKTGTLAGDGRIEAAGADAYSSAGGGGAIGIEYGSTSGTVLSGTRTKGGGSQFATGRGGAGTIYLKGPGATYGTLNVDNLGTSGQATVLPSLGSGTAQEGTSGATLVTQLTSIPAYFEGHWVEVRRGESLLGTWRIGEITGGTVTLEPNEVESIALLAGDTWQGVYRFDRVVVTGNAVLQSADPIRTPTIELTGPTGTGGYTEIPEAVVATTVVVSGNVLTTGITATTLTVKAGAKLTSPASTATEAKSLVLDVSGVLTIEEGGSIDVSGRGYPADATYPGGAPGANAAGSHLGVGGPQGAGTVAGTYGSVTRPQEAGSGGFGSYAQPGGGVIRIEAGSVVLGGANAAILANGGGNHSNVGAGGSVWIKTGTLAGDGRIEAAGADAYSSAGGGGAIGIEYGSTSGTVLSGTRTKGGGSQFATGRGGAGTIYLKGPGATYGTLNVDNLGTSGQATVLPSLGSGTAQEGTSGATLVTQLTSIPAYFEGHWVEVRRGESLLGTWRIGEITGGTVTLEPNEVESIALLAGDTWQGVYRFDRVVVTGNAVLQSADPIRTPTIELTGPTGTGGYTEIPEAVVATTVVVSGNVLTTGITATTLTVKAGAKLTSPASTATEAKSLVLDVSGVLTIEEGGSIDVSGRGYPADATYPGGAPGANAAGSHLGVGGPQGAGTVAGTYGSVTRPQEAGSGGFGSYAQPGGGVIRIEAGSVVLGGANAAILANGGGNHSNVGAGGSVWIKTGTLAGDGRIEAAGADAYSSAGGGGAIGIEYGSTSGTVLSGTRTKGGGSQFATGRGGAGTIYLKGPGATYGTLNVDNLGTSGQATVLPSLGSGTAQEGTSGATLVTQLTSIPAYFEGHWVEVRRGESLLGTWRIGEITGGTVTLEPNEVESIALLAGDTWQGVYRFDRVVVTGNAVLQSLDTVYDGLPTITVTSPGPNTAFASGSSVPVTFQTADDRGVSKVELSLGGPAVQIPGATQTSGVVKAPWVGTNTLVPLEATVVDSIGQSTTASVPLTVLAAPSLTASISHPWEDAKLWAGTSQEVRVQLPDARPIRRVTIRLGTFSMDFEDVVGPTLDVSILIPPVTVDEDRLLTATVEDGLSAPVTSPAVPVTLLVDNGPRVTAWTEAVSPVNAGSRVQVDFSAYFRSWEGSRLRLQVTGSMSYERTYNAGEFGSGGAGGVGALDVANSISWSFPSFQIPADARGPMTIVVTAIDGAGREALADPIDLEVTSPFSIAVVGSGVVAPGGTLELALSATGCCPPQSVDLAIGGAFEWARPVSLGESYGESETVSRTIRIPVPRNALGEGAAAFEAYMDGGEGGYSRGALAAKLDEGTVSSNTVTFSVVDDVDPVVARVRSSEWGLVSGAEASFRADVSDNGTVQAVRFFVDDVLIATVSEPTELSTYDSGPYLLPTAAEERSVVVRVEATDLAGRSSSAVRSLIVAPAGTPLVRFRAPTSGAMAVAGQTLPLLAELRHSRPITQLAFYRDDEGSPFATRSGDDLEAEFVVPPGTTPGSEITLWVEATDDLGAVGEASTVVKLVGGTLLTDGTVLNSDDASNEDQTIVVQGRVEVRGEHRFARLVILPGAVLTHAATAGETIERLDLEVTGDVYVSPTATIDAIGLGFEGGLQRSNPSPEGRTVPGLQGAPAGLGGSHAGAGEVADDEWGAETYGSCRAPDLPGGGGGASLSGDPGGSGGGVIKLRVGGRLIVDGSIDASGISGEGGAAGAGGCVQLEAISIGGTGRVLAMGGDPGTLVGRGGSAGGGRIAVLGPLEDAAPVLSSASGPVWYASGGAGTLFLRSPEDLHGHLVVDGGASSRVGWTYLTEVGWRSGYLAGEADLVVRIEPFPTVVDLVGKSIEITQDGALVGRFRIEESRPQEGTVTLDESAAHLLPWWGLDLRGVQVFDTVNVKARAALDTFEVLEGVVQVGPAAWMWTDSDSVCPEDPAPWLSTGTLSVEAWPGGNVVIDVESDDSYFCSGGEVPGAVVQYSVWIDGVEGSLLEVPIAGTPEQDARPLTYVLPASLPLGEHLLVVEVRDQTNQKTATAFRIRVSEEPGLVERLPAGSGQRSHPISLRSSKRFARTAREGAGPVRTRGAGRGPQEPH